MRNEHKKAKSMSGITFKGIFQFISFKIQVIQFILHHTSIHSCHSNYMTCLPGVIQNYLPTSTQFHLCQKGIYR